jgi:hypothetical protein
MSGSQAMTSERFINHNFRRLIALQALHPGLAALGILFEVVAWHQWTNTINQEHHVSFEQQGL